MAETVARLQCLLRCFADVRICYAGPDIDLPVYTCRSELEYQSSWHLYVHCNQPGHEHAEMPLLTTSERHFNSHSAQDGP